MQSVFHENSRHSNWLPLRLTCKTQLCLFLWVLSPTLVLKQKQNTTTKWRIRDWYDWNSALCCKIQILSTNTEQLHPQPVHRLHNFTLHFLPSCRCPAERWRRGCLRPVSSAVKRPPRGAQWSTAADDWSPAKHNSTSYWMQQNNNKQTHIQHLVSCKTQWHIKLNAAKTTIYKHTADNWSSTKHNSTSNWMQQNKQQTNERTDSWWLVSYKTQQHRIQHNKQQTHTHKKKIPTGIAKKTLSQASHATLSFDRLSVLCIWLSCFTSDSKLRSKQLPNQKLSCIMKTQVEFSTMKLLSSTHLRAEIFWGTL